MKDMTCKRPNRRITQSGLAVVEFVIVLPLLITIVVATLELGRYIYQYNTLTKAVQAGARYAGDNSLTRDGVIMTGTPLTNLVAETQNLVAFSNIVAGNGTEILDGIAAADVTVTTVDLGGFSISPNHIKVSADYDFNYFFDFIPDHLNPTMTASTVHPAI